MSGPENQLPSNAESAKKDSVQQPNTDSQPPKPEKWLEGLLAFNYQPPAREAPTPKPINPFKPPAPEHPINTSRLWPVKHNSDGLLVQRVKSVIGGNVDCVVEDFVQKVNEDFIPNQTTIRYTAHREDGSIEPLKGLSIPFNGLKPEVRQNVQMVTQTPIIVDGEITGYDCMIDSYPEPAGDGSTDYLVQSSRCLVVLTENKNGTISAKLTPSFIDGKGRISTEAPQDDSNLEGYQAWYHATVLRYAGVVDELDTKDVLDEKTGQVVQIGEKVKTGQLIPAGLIEKSFYVDRNGGRIGRALQISYLDENGKPAADASKPVKAAVYDPASPTDKPTELATIDFKDGRLYVRREWNYQGKGKDAIVEFDPATEDWIKFQFTYKDAHGKEQLHDSIERIDDTRLLVRSYGAVEIKSLHSTMPDHGNIAYVINAKPSLDRPGEKDFFIEETTVTDSKSNEIYTLKGNLTFKHDPRTGAITSIDGAEFSYRGKTIPPDRLAKMLTENKPLNRHLQHFFKQMESLNKAR